MIRFGDSWDGSVVETFQKLVIGAIPRRRNSLVVNRHSDQFLDDTIEFWQRRMSRELSREDARQMVDNVCGFFQVLLEWEAAQRADEELAGDANRGDDAKS